MTDGIIQTAFNQFRAKRLGHYITHEETLHLERELIEKIKEKVKQQEDSELQDGYPCYFLSLFALIGDNNE